MLPVSPLSGLFRMVSVLLPLPNQMAYARMTSIAAQAACNLGTGAVLYDGEVGTADAHAA